MSAPLFMGCRYPDVRAASLVHTLSGPEREEAGHLMRHVLRPWSLYMRAFSSRRRADRWALGACRADDNAALPPVFLPQHGRVVRARLATGARLFDLAVASDCVLFLRSVAEDTCLEGVLVTAVRQAGAPSPTLSGTTSGASATLQSSRRSASRNVRTGETSRLRAASRLPARSGWQRMGLALPTAGALASPVAWRYESPAKRARLTAPRRDLSLLPTVTGSPLSLSARDLLGMMQSKQSVFLTGPPGCGKTQIVKEVKEALHAAGWSVAVCGSSGVAAALIDGVTAHAWAGFRNGHHDETAPLAVVLNQVIPSAAKARMSGAQVLIIDEATTLSATFYDRLDDVLQHVRGDLSPFGGLVVLCAGDFLQVCPPRGEYAFKSAVWNRVFGRRAMILESNYRQAGDPDYSQLLLRLRLGKHTKEDVARLVTRQATSTPPDDCVWLFCLKSSAAEKNQEELEKLRGPVETFEAVDRCIAPYLNDTRATHLLNSATKSLRVLKLRVGARVIVATNAFSAKGVSAGSRGTVTSFSRIGHVRLPTVEFELARGGTSSVVVGPVEARVMAFDGVSKAATRWQLPLVPAWASTIHGAQGWTLKRVAADLSEAFAPGQVLSALSRTRRLCDIFLVGFDESKVLVCPDALSFYSSLSSL